MKPPPDKMEPRRRAQRSQRARGTRRGALLALAIGSTLAWMLALGGSALAQGVQLVPFGGQGFASPYHVAGAPADPSRVFVVEEQGTIRLVKAGVTQPTPFLDISAEVMDGAEGGGGCECGLLSMAPAPDYASSGRFYVFYTHDVSPGLHELRIEEYRRSSSNPNIADPASDRIVIDIPHPDAVNHNGGQLQFGPDGLLYIWVGDGGPPANGQPLDRLLGKLLRIDPGGAAPGQYSIPTDNPYVGPDGARDEIYASGVRNPWRGSFDRSTGDLTFGDVGQNSREEIDFKLEGTGRGANFGWNCFEGLAVAAGCPVPNHSPPVLDYPNGGSGAAVAGGYVIRDSALPTLAGRYIYADSYNALGGQLRTAVLTPSGAVGDAPLLGLGDVVSFGQDACGHIYAASLSAGQVLRLQPTSGPFPCKTAPKLKVLDTRGSRRAGRKLALAVRAACDEDCALTATGRIVFKGARKGAKAGRLRGARGRTEVEMGGNGIVRVRFSKKQAKKLRAKLAAGKRAVAHLKISATGGGGGTDTVSRRVKQKR